MKYFIINMKVDKNDMRIHLIDEELKKKRKKKLLKSSRCRNLPALGKLKALVTEDNEESVFQAAGPLECAEFMLAGVRFLMDPMFYPRTDAQLHRWMKAFPFLIESLLNAPTGSFGFLNEK